MKFKNTKMIRKSLLKIQRRLWNYKDNYKMAMMSMMKIRFSKEQLI